MILINSRLAAFVLFAGALLMGFAQIALLPPWEGFDEPQHYSYIQQLDETGSWPRRGDPMSRNSLELFEAVPSVDSVRLNYPVLFANSDGLIERARAAIKDPPVQGRSWQVGKEANWQAQHPPLYYALMTPAYRLSKGWSLAHQLLLLRGLSYFLAWLGLVLAATVILRAGGPKSERAAFLAAGLWPVLFPMWFPEMARLGNDSLLVIFSACSFALVRRLTVAPGNAVQYALLGLLIGLGLLTKATFLPLTASIIAILVFQLYSARHDTRDLVRRLKGLVILALITIAVCGWWYVGKFIETGSLIGADVLALLNVSDNSAPTSPLNDNPIKLPWLFAQTFLWYGTWSSVLPPRILAYTLVATTGVFAFGAYRYIRRHGADVMGCLSLLTLLTFLSSLTYMAVATSGIAGGEAWYLHAFAPVLLPLLGFGVAGLIWTRLGRAALGIAFAYPLVFVIVATAVNLLYFAGCGATGQNTRFFDLASVAHCAGDVVALYGNLNVIAFPAVFLPLFVAGWGLCLAGVIVAWRVLRGWSKCPAVQGLCAGKIQPRMNQI